MTNKQWRGIATGSSSALMGIGGALSASGIGAPIGIPLALMGAGLGLGIGGQFIKDDMPIPMATNISNSIMTMPRMRDGGVVNNDSIFSYMMGFKPKATRGMTIPPDDQFSGLPIKGASPAYSTELMYKFDGNDAILPDLGKTTARDMTIPPYDQSGDIEFVNKQLIPDYANIQNQLDLNLGTKDYLRLPVGYGGNRPILEIAGTPPYSDMTKVEGLPNLRKVTTRPEAGDPDNLDVIKNAIMGKYPYNPISLGGSPVLSLKGAKGAGATGGKGLSSGGNAMNEYDKMARNANIYNMVGTGIMGGSALWSLINEMTAQAPDKVSPMASRDIVLDKDQSDFLNYMNRNIDSSRNMAYKTATSMGADPLLTSVMLHNTSLGAKMQAYAQANQTRQQIAMTQEQINAQQKQSAQQQKLQADQFNAQMQFHANQLSGQNIASSIGALGMAVTGYGQASMRNKIFAEAMKKGEFSKLLGYN